MSTAPQKPAAPTKKPRSPGEKLVVWGGIIVLLMLVGVQAHARFGYEMSLKKLQARVAEDDNGSIEGSPLYLSDVPTFLVGWPSRKVEEERHWHAVTYSWQGLGKSYSIRMPYDTSEDKPVVLSLETADAPVPPRPEDVAAAGGSGDAHAAPPSMTSMPAMTGGPALGGGGPGGGGPRPDIMESDKDGDGKVSKEEAPERMARFFDNMDENKDGFIDAEEAAAARQRRAEREAAGGGPGGGAGRRPQTEGDAPAETPADAEGAVKAVATEAAAAPAAEEKPAP